MKKEDFHKGQIVWVYLIGNAARGLKTTDERIKEWEVVTVGRKYITVRPKGGLGWEQKFDIENDFRHVYTFGCSDYELHLTKEEIYKQVERVERIEYIERFCNWSRRNLNRMNDEDLQTVEEIFKRYERCAEK